MKKVNKFIQKQPRRNLAIGGLVIILLIVGISLHFFHSAKATTTTRTAGARGEQVSVASVESLSPDNASLSVIGKVESENEATILAQTAGEIVSVDHALGDHVSAGETIATMENSSQQATVVQAEGAYDSAEATLAKVSGTTAENSDVTSTQASTTAENAQEAATASLQSAYAALDDAIHTKTDVVFNGPRGGEATVNQEFEIPDSQLIVNIQMERNALEPVLTNAQNLLNDTVVSDTDTNITTMASDAQTVEALLNNLIEMINETTPNGSLTQATISGYQTTFAAARTEVVSAISSLTSAKSTYDSDAASATTATNTADTGSESDIAVAQANVQTALGSLEAAKAALAKTIITSPISGTIIDLPITSGDYVTSFSEAAEVSNPSALKIVSYVTADDAATLAVGGKATVQGTVDGVITNVAPAIDPETGTIEVDIGLSGDESSLVDGDSVTVDLDRATPTASPKTPANNQTIIPIVSLKITPTGPVVFTVDAASKTLKSHPVTIGSILGDNIVVTSGLTPDMLIVTDARGLTDGEIVTIKK